MLGIAHTYTSVIRKPGMLCTEGGEEDNGVGQSMAVKLPTPVIRETSRGEAVCPKHSNQLCSQATVRAGSLKHCICKADKISPQTAEFHNVNPSSLQNNAVSSTRTVVTSRHFKADLDLNSAPPPSSIV